MADYLYEYTVPAGGHWSFKIKKGMALRCTDVAGGGNLGALFYNPENLLERYNAPDTLKCQHTFKLTAGHCLYSDMGRIFCSIIEDDIGWHETVAGNSTAKRVAKLWQSRDYQTDRNEWKQNGYDSFLVELAKYGLTAKDMAANVNFFSKVSVSEEGDMQYHQSHSKPGSSVTLRFEMDTLVVLHACPHPMNAADTYPAAPIHLGLFEAAKIQDDDLCMTSCDENRRGFENNKLYYLGA